MHPDCSRLYSPSHQSCLPAPASQQAHRHSPSALPTLQGANQLPLPLLLGASCSMPLSALPSRQKPSRPSHLGKVAFLEISMAPLVPPRLGHDEPPAALCHTWLPAEVEEKPTSAASEGPPLLPWLGSLSCLPPTAPDQSQLPAAPEWLVLELVQLGPAACSAAPDPSQLPGAPGSHALEPVQLGPAACLAARVPLGSASSQPESKTADHVLVGPSFLTLSPPTLSVLSLDAALGSQDQLCFPHSHALAGLPSHPSSRDSDGLPQRSFGMRLRCRDPGRTLVSDPALPPSVPSHVDCSPSHGQSPSGGSPPANDHMRHDPGALPRSSLHVYVLHPRCRKEMRLHSPPPFRRRR